MRVGRHAAAQREPHPAQARTRRGTLRPLGMLCAARATATTDAAAPESPPEAAPKAPARREPAAAAALLLALSLALAHAPPAEAEGLSTPAPEAFAPAVLSPRGEALLLEPPPEGLGDDAETTDIPTRQAAVSLLPQARRKGLASWYGLKFHRRRTASGEVYDMHGLTAAHPSLPFGTRVCVRSRDTGRSVVVRINDRSAYSSRRVIDLSKGAASALGIVGLGLKPVELSVLAPNRTECAP